MVGVSPPYEVRNTGKVILFSPAQALMPTPLHLLLQTLSSSVLCMLIVYDRSSSNWAHVRLSTHKAVFLLDVSCHRSLLHSKLGQHDPTPCWLLCLLPTDHLRVRVCLPQSAAVQSAG